DAEVVGAAAGGHAAERLPVAGAGLVDAAAATRQRVIRAVSDRISRLDPGFQLGCELNGALPIRLRHTPEFAHLHRKVQRPPAGTRPAGAAATDRGVEPRCLRVMSPSAYPGPPRR